MFAVCSFFLGLGLEDGERPRSNFLAFTSLLYTKGPLRAPERHGCSYSLGSFLWRCFFIKPYNLGSELEPLIVETPKMETQHWDPNMLRDSSFCLAAFPGLPLGRYLEPRPGKACAQLSLSLVSFIWSGTIWRQ